MGSNNTTGAQIEIRYSPATRSVSSDIARDIAYNHLHDDIVIIVNGSPTSAHSAFRKQWVQVQRTVERERSSTFNATKVQKLNDQLARMEALLFTVAPAQPHAVLITTAADFLSQPSKDCRILYLTHPVSDNLLAKMSSKMSGTGLIVRYLRPELRSEHAAVRNHPWRTPM